MQPAPVTGRLAKITRAMVQRMDIVIAAPHANIENILNMLPIFYPVAF